MGSFRVGLRIDDVRTGMRFYGGLGFEEVMSVPNPEGRLVFAILERDGVHLCLDALVGMPFPDNERERLTQRGPRGLGVALGLGVDDLDAVYEYCVSTGCEITSEIAEEAWGDRAFEFTDPSGYVWEVSQPNTAKTVDEARNAVAANWFG